MDSTRKGAHSEGQQAGHTHECAFRKKEKATTSSAFFSYYSGIFYSLPLIETFDKKGAYAFQ
jgi:hypothetical protein